MAARVPATPLLPSQRARRAARVGGAFEQARLRIADHGAHAAGAPVAVLPGREIVPETHEALARRGGHARLHDRAIGDVFVRVEGPREADAGKARRLDGG